jgi:uncharacterized protein YdhG (YjbR/CyaY superfamily)
MKPILIKNYKDYLKKLPADRKIRFQQFHEIIIKAAPSVEMGISYRMPCLKMEGIIFVLCKF